MTKEKSHCEFRFKNHWQCREKRKEDCRFCFMHDPEMPYIQFVRNHKRYLKGQIFLRKKKTAERLVSLGVAQYFEKNLTRKKLDRHFCKAIRTLRNGKRDFLSWLIKIGDDETLLDWLGDHRSEKDKVKEIKIHRFNLNDRLYLARLAEIPATKLIKMKMGKLG